MSMTFSISGPAGYGGVGPAADTRLGMDEILAAQQAAQAFKGGVPALAKAMAISPNTLQHKLNPGNTRHHLTLRESIELQRITRDVGVLRAMAKALGYVCVLATPDQSDGDPVQAFANLHGEVADFSRAVADALAQQPPSPNAQRRIDYHAQQLIAAACHMVSTTAAMVPKRAG